MKTGSRERMTGAVHMDELSRAHGGRIGDIGIYRPELNYPTWRLAKINLAIRGIDGRIEQGDSLLDDRLPDLKADYIMGNPPFNMKSWGGEHLQDDRRWKYGVPPKGNANFAWVQHMIYHLAPSGLAGFVLANGSMSSNQSSEGEIRRNIVEAALVDCMVALPGQLFYSTQIPACLWFLPRDKKNGRFRDRGARCSSLMRARWGAWWTVGTAGVRGTRRGAPMTGQTHMATARAPVVVGPLGCLRKAQEAGRLQLVYSDEPFAVETLL